MNSSCAKRLKESLCELIPWDYNQLYNLSYPTMPYICKGSLAWQKGGWCPALWYYLLFINLHRLILAQSALHPEIFMAGKEFGLPCKTHWRHLRLPKQRASHWDKFERPSWKETMFPSRIYPTVYQCHQIRENTGIHSEWERAICWILWVSSSFLADLTMGISEVEFNNIPLLSCKSHLIAAQPKNWEPSILLNIPFRSFTLFKSFLSSVCSFSANRRPSSPVLYLFACW